MGYPLTVAQSPIVGRSAATVRLAAITGALTALIGAVVVVIHLPYSGSAVANDLLVIERWRWSVAPEPTERTVFLVVVAVLLPCMLAVRWVLGRKTGMNSPAWMALAGIAGTLALITYFSSAAFWYMLTGRGLSFDGETIAVLSTWAAGSVAAAVALTCLPSWRFGAKTWRSGLSLTLIVFAALIGGALRFRSSAAVYGDPHFDSVFYAMSQVLAGGTVLADLPAQYGLYAEFLSSFIAPFSSPTVAFAATMALMQAVASVLFVLAGLRLIRSGMVQTLFVATVALFVGTTWAIALAGPVGREYYALWPIRFFFPALMLWLIVGRPQLTPRRLIVLGAACGIGLLWNYDWSIPAWGGIVALYLLRVLFGSDRTKACRDLAVIVVVPLLVVAASILYLEVKSGWRLEIADWLKFQLTFYGLGFGMFPLPLNPHPWMILAAIYLLGLAAGVNAIATGRATLKSDALIILAVTGIGVFAYYQGRSHDVVMTMVVWPALVIGFVFCDTTIRAVRRGLLPRWIIVTAVPALAIGVSSAAYIAMSAPHLFDGVATTMRDIGREPADVAFVRDRISPGDKVSIIGAGQSILFAEAGHGSAIAGPGDMEMILVTDFERRLNDLRLQQIDALFLKAGKDGTFPSEYAPLLDLYAEADHSPDGLILLRPK